MEEIDSTQTIQLGDALGAQVQCPARYKVEALVGQGGMGMVFRAQDTELNRTVAIKILLFEGAHEEEVHVRFLREAKALALLDHPNIVRIFSSGINEQGNPYHVMEFLEGESLSRELQAGPLTAAHFFEVFSQVLCGLEHAHKENIVHRDLKPANIMRCVESDGTVLYKIIDFGIARINLNPEEHAKTLTKSNAILGSPHYISPEQCRGQRGDFLSDIYSLGCIMYECIIGHPPFQGETAFETMYKHMTEPSIKLDVMAVSVQSKRLATLIDRCLEKKPELRPQSVSEIAIELNEAFSEGSAYLDLFSNKPKSIQKGHRPLIMTGVSLLLIVVTAAAIGWRVYIKSSLMSEVSIGKKHNEDEAVLAEIKRVEARLSSKKNLDDITSPSQLAQVQQDLFALGRLQLKSPNKTDYAQAEKTYTQALELCSKHKNLFGDCIPGCYALRAKSEWKQGDFLASDSDFSKAIEVANHEEMHLTVVHDVLMERALLRIHQRRYADGLGDYMIIVKYYESFDNRKNGFLGALDQFDFIDQRLDRRGENRLSMTNNMAIELRTMIPQSETEAEEMFPFARRLVRSLSKINMNGDAKLMVEFTKTEIMPKIKDQSKYMMDLKTMEEQANSR